ncbi:hypothetical protein DFJ77DRAFT_511408 [Powellomyces hirtus]|nr:hypothetical protein DFJ77DRAFT_511408 [Powellomyces hirtus]
MRAQVPLNPEAAIFYAGRSSSQPVGDLVSDDDDQVSLATPFGALGKEDEGYDSENMTDEAMKEFEPRLLDVQDRKASSMKKYHIHPLSLSGTKRIHSSRSTAPRTSQPTDQKSSTYRIKTASTANKSRNYNTKSSSSASSATGSYIPTTTHGTTHARKRKTVLSAAEQFGKNQKASAENAKAEPGSSSSSYEDRNGTGRGACAFDNEDDNQSVTSVDCKNENTGRGACAFDNEDDNQSVTSVECQNENNFAAPVVRRSCTPAGAPGKGHRRACQGPRAPPFRPEETTRLLILHAKHGNNWDKVAAEFHAESGRSAKQLAKHVSNVKAAQGKEPRR